MLTQFFSQKVLSLTSNEGRLGITTAQGTNGPVWCCEVIPKDIKGGIMGMVRWMAGDEVADLLEGTAVVGESLSDWVKLEGNSLDLVGIATMELNQFRLAFEKQESQEEGTDPGSIYTLAFAGELSLSDWATVKGDLVFQIKPNSPTAIQFQLDAGSTFPVMEVPIPGYEDLVLRPSLSVLDIAREENNGNKTSAVVAEGSMRMSGGPYWLMEHLPNDLAFQLTIASIKDVSDTTNLVVSLTIPSVMEDVTVDLPEVPQLIKIPGLPDLTLGTINVLLCNLSVVVESQSGYQPYVTIDCGIGLPEDFNKLAGTDAKGEPNFDWINTFDPELPDETRITGRLSLKPEGLEFEPLTSPIKGIETQSKSNVPGSQQGNTWIIDLEDEGLIHLDPPVLARSSTSQAMSASGGFEIKKDLKISLEQLHDLIDDVLFVGASEALPEYLEIKDIALLKNNQLSTEDLGNLWGDTLTEALQLLFDDMAGLVEYLPENLKAYFSFTVPDKFYYNFRMNADGSAMGGVSFSGESVKLLLPSGMSLLGIELRKINLGQLNGGKLGLLEIDATFDHFFLPEVVASMILSAAKTPLLPASKDLYTRLELREVMAIVNFQSSTVMPLFHNKIALSRLGGEGFEMASQFNLPKPVPDLLQLIELAVIIIDFLTLSADEPDGLLDADKMPEAFDTYFRIGQQYIKTPEYTAKQLLGEEVEVLKRESDKAWPLVAHAFNFLKTGRIDEFVQSFPIEDRTGTKTLDFYSLLAMKLAWVVSSPEEFEEEAFEEINLESTDLESTMGILPESSDTNRLVTWLHGEVSIAEVVSLSTTFLFNGGFSGATTGFRIKGMLVDDLIGVALAGSVTLETDPAAFALRGTSELLLLDQPVLTGKVGLSDQELFLSGELDLFPTSDNLTLSTFVEGRFASDGVSIKGEVDFTAGGVTVVKGSVILTEASLTVEGTFLEVLEASLSLEADSDGWKIAGSIELPERDVSLETLPISFEGLQLVDALMFDLPLTAGVTVEATPTSFAFGAFVEFNLMDEDFTVALALDIMPPSLEEVWRLITEEALNQLQAFLIDLFQRPEKIIEILLQAFVKAIDGETWSSSLKGEEGEIGLMGIQSRYFNLYALAAYLGNESMDNLFAYGQSEKVSVQLPSTHIEALSVAIVGNRKAKLPKASKVREYPLIKRLDDGHEIGEKANKNNLPMAEAAIKGLIKKLPRRDKTYTFAVGFKSNSFDFLKAKNVLMVELGSSIATSLVGTTDIKFPEKKPIVALGTDYLVSIGLSSGTVNIHGELNKDSYIITSELSLSGGFAYYMWLRDKHAGDFVVSIGGYHPKFKVPEHYPNVSRVKLEWKMTDAISVEGKMYATFTPSHLMIGGKLDLSVKMSGKSADKAIDVAEQKLGKNVVVKSLSHLEDLVPQEIKSMDQSTELFEASMSLSFDVLLGWEPMAYHVTVETGFTAEIKLKQVGTAVFKGVEVVRELVEEIPYVKEVTNFLGELVEETGVKKVYEDVEKTVSKTANYVASKLINPKGTLELELWGPKFGGNAHFKGDVFSFTLGLGGSSDSSQGQKMKESAFNEKYLGNKQLDLVVKQGVLHVTDESDGRWFVVDPDQVEIAYKSNLPFKKIAIGDWSSSEKTFHLAPVEKVASASKWNLIVSYEGPEGMEFQAEPSETGFPKAVWGSRVKPRLSSKTTLQLMSGMRLVAEPGKPPGFTDSVDADEFRFQDVVENDPVWQWGTETPYDYEQESHANSVQMQDTLMSDQAQKRRQKLADFLGYALQLSMEQTASNPEQTFIGIPRQATKKSNS